MRCRPNGDVRSIWGKIGFAVGIQRDVCLSDCFEDNVKLRRRWILDQRFVNRLLRVIVELVPGQHD